MSSSSANQYSQSSISEVESFNSKGLVPSVGTTEENKECSKQNFESSIIKCSSTSNSVPLDMYINTLHLVERAALSVYIRGKPKGTATLVEACGRKCIIGSNKILSRKILSMEIQTIEFRLKDMPNEWPFMLNKEGT